MPRKNIILRRLAMPKKVTLPNRRIFFAKYARVSARGLPQDVRIARKYVRKIGPRRQRKHRGISFQRPTQKLKITSLKVRIKQAVAIAVEPKTLLVAIITKISGNISVGISNVEIKAIFSDVNNGNLNKNFIGVFPSNKIIS